MFVLCGLTSRAAMPLQPSRQAVRGMYIKSKSEHLHKGLDENVPVLGSAAGGSPCQP